MKETVTSGNVNGRQSADDSDDDRFTAHISL
jgi:hypothetical protein